MPSQPCFRWNRIGAWFLLAMCLLLVGTTVASTRSVTVITEDGRRLSGELLGADEHKVVLEVAGIRMPMRRDEIERIEERRAPEAYYQQRRAELDEDDLVGRVELAVELSGMRAHDLALAELGELREADPENESLARIARTIEARQALEQQPASERRRGRARPDAVAAPGSDRPAERLTPAQINRIRVYEVDLAERPRIHVPRRTLEKLFDRYADHEAVPRDRIGQATLRRAPGFEQLAVLFDAQARELYDEVRVRDDSPALRGFRTQIHQQYVLNYCATNQCHGGDDGAGGLKLFTHHANTDATVYTNFFLLHQHVNDDGRMIDRNNPERSLLLQYGLARNSAARPHPEAPGWRPHFRSTDDARLRNFRQILGELYRPTPDYGIEYPPPASNARDKPAADEADEDERAAAEPNDETAETDSDNDATESGNGASPER